MLRTDNGYSRTVHASPPGSGLPNQITGHAPFSPWERFDARADGDKSTMLTLLLIVLILVLLFGGGGGYYYRGRRRRL